MTEHDKAIQESERNAAASEYFDAGFSYAPSTEALRVRTFDDGFDRGWAAHARRPRNFCPDCGQRTPAGSVHTCSPQVAALQDALASEMNYAKVMASKAPQPDGDSWGAGIQSQPTYLADQQARNQKARAALDDMPCTQPPYPEGEVVGACVCGSWPGGECLKCPWIPAKDAP